MIIYINFWKKLSNSDFEYKSVMYLHLQKILKTQFWYLFKYHDSEKKNIVSPIQILVLGLVQYLVETQNPRKKMIRIFSQTKPRNWKHWKDSYHLCHMVKYLCQMIFLGRKKRENKRKIEREKNMYPEDDNWRDNW